MAQPKKRPSKKAKAALKILEDSKLLENTKNNNESKTDQLFKQNDSSTKTATAHKDRPNKKRG